MSKRFIFLVLFYWVLGINVLTVYLLSSLEGYIEILKIDTNTLPEISKYLLSYHQYLESTLFGILFALLYILGHSITERREFGRMSFGRIILAKSVFYFLGFGLIFGIIYFIMVTVLGLYPEGALANISLTKSTVISISSFGVILISQIVFLNFIIQADKTFGHSNLLNFVTGKYHSPVIEDRVFLFIDLKDSTTHAERLGNIKYSMLIKDCFDDLNILVRKYHAEIYQYVGDEVVITWPTAQTSKKPYCIDFFFAFRNLLESRATYYTDKYGLVPKFKAGANGGEVTATEIGDVKRDIAYHGDVINTASRIQGACNEQNESYLIEAGLYEKLPKSIDYKALLINDLKLKGKQEAINVYGISLS